MPFIAWRQIETALVAVCRAYGHTIDQHFDSGDKVIHEAIILPDTDTVDDLNLTELAKDLERELKL